MSATTANLPGAGSAIRALRAASGMTAREVADLAGVSYHQLTRVESGAVKPSAAWVFLVVEAIGKRIEAAA